jgi:predicted alpha/beta-hydrolase family hydrolase
VRTLDYPYMREGRRRPDRLPVLVEAHRSAAAALDEGAGPLVFAGKSMGSRVGCHLALERAPSALVCFGYPLRSPAGKLRDEVLLGVSSQLLFVQGTRDPLCPLDALDGVRKRMTAPNALVVVDEGDHSLLVTKRWLHRHGKTQDDVDQATLAAVAHFLDEHAAPRPPAPLVNVGR